MAVLPSAERKTEVPCKESPSAPEPTSLVPCWVQAPALLFQTHAAPTAPLSPHPPTMAVLPSAERDTEAPRIAFPTALEPTSFGPCCENCATAVCVRNSMPMTVNPNFAAHFIVISTPGSVAPGRDVRRTVDLDVRVRADRIPLGPRYGPRSAEERLLAAQE